MQIKNFYKKTFDAVDDFLFDTKKISKQNFILGFIGLNLLIVLFIYFFAIKSFLTDIKTFKTQGTSGRVFSEIDFSQKKAQIQDFLDLKDFKKIQNLSLKNFKRNLEQKADLLNLQEFDLIENSNDENISELQVFAVTNWRNFEQLLQFLNQNSARFFIKDFDISSKDQVLQFSLKIYDIKNSLKENLEKNDESAEAIFYSFEQNNEFFENEESFNKVEKLVSKIDFEKLNKKLANLSKLKDNIFTQEKLHLTNIFQWQKDLEFLANSQKGVLNSLSASGNFVNSNTNSGTNKGLKLVGIMGSDSKLQATILLNNQNYQTLQEGDLIKNTNLKVTKIWLKKSSIKLLNTKTKKSIVLKSE